MRVNRMSLKKEVKDVGMQVLFHFHRFHSSTLPQVSLSLEVFGTLRQKGEEDSLPFHTVRVLRWDVGRLLVKCAIVAYQRRSLLMPS